MLLGRCCSELFGHRFQGKWKKVKSSERSEDLRSALRVPQNLRSKESSRAGCR